MRPGVEPDVPREVQHPTQRVVDSYAYRLVVFHLPPWRMVLGTVERTATVLLRYWRFV